MRLDRANAHCNLDEMVNIGTLLAFVMVCTAVMVLRFQRPNAHRPFRCPLIYVLAPLGVLVNLTLTLFLPLDTWLRLVIWLVWAWLFTLPTAAAIAC